MTLRSAVFCSTLLCTGLFFFCIAVPAHAATVHYYVDPLGTDSVSNGTGTGSSAWATIQYAIDNVANPTTDTIIINISGDTYTTNNDDIDINRSFTDLTLQGAASGVTIIQPHANPASATAGNIDITSGETVTIKDMTIRYGRTTYSGPGIRHAGTALTLDKVTIHDNDASGGLKNGGVHATESITVTNSTFSDNTGNYVGGIAASGGVAKITNSTFLNNTGVSHGGAIGVGCGTTGIVTNTTIIGGNEGVSSFCSSSIIYIMNTLVADQTSLGVDSSGRTLYNGGYNIIETHDMGAVFDNDSTTLTGNQTNLNISSTLADNSTSNGTQTLALSSGSVALDVGTTTAHGPSGNEVVPLSTDQRGFGRSGIIDIGAFELQSDSTPPTVSYFNPADNATDVGINAMFEVAFNENVATSTGNVVLYKTSDDSTVETIDITSGQVTASSTTAFIIDPSTTLDGETEYYFFIDATAFDDTAGNSYTGITASTTWSFTTADITNPTVATLSPADDATDVSIDANLVITFNEAVATSTGTVALKKTSDDSTIESFNVASSALVTGSGTTYTINPTADLDYETGYYVQIAATAFDDTSGNSYAGITDTTSWNFTTENTPTCPAVANAATYHAYPTCGPATCNDGYTLSGSQCVSSGGGGTVVGLLGTTRILKTPNYIPPRMQTIYPDGTVVYHDEIPGGVSAQEETPTQAKPTPEPDPTVAHQFTFTRNLRADSQGEDVRMLQQFLNTHGFTLAPSGLGSPGSETAYFGPLTYNALVTFQEANTKDILAPLGLTRGTGIFGPATRAFIEANYGDTE